MTEAKDEKGRAAQAVTPYQQLLRALVDGGARRLAEVDGPNAGQAHGSALEFWNVPNPRPGRLVIVQRWTGGESGARGCWDAYIQISESRTEAAIAAVIGQDLAATTEPKPTPQLSVRPATEEEALEILGAYAERTGEIPDDIFGQRVYIAQSYITACPGYVGPVALIHWDGSPEFVTALTYSPAGAGYAWQVQDGARERANALTAKLETCARALELAFVELGRSGANSDRSHPARKEWELARDALKSIGRLT